jgi:hypothetical protein
MKSMFKWILPVVVSLVCEVATAQPVIHQYAIKAKLSEECESILSLPLFDKAYKADSLNTIIINELTKYHYGMNNPGLSVQRFYSEIKYGPDAPIDRNIVAQNTFAKGGIYSFVAVPINACDKEEYSTYPSIALTLDSANFKPLQLKDIIKPGMLDTFDGFALWVIKRYAIKNLPAGYVISARPPELKSSNSLIGSAGKIEWERGLQPQFYVKQGKMYLYNYATHEHYNFNSVEIALPITMLEHFLQPKYFTLFN